jgi:hypothetical protein
MPAKSLGFSNGANLHVVGRILKCNEEQPIMIWSKAAPARIRGNDCSGIRAEFTQLR